MNEVEEKTKSLGIQEKRKLNKEEIRRLVLEIKNENVEEAKKIIDLMIDVDQEIEYFDNEYDDNILGNAFLLSCVVGNVELVEYLIEFGADLNKEDSVGYSVLMNCTQIEIFNVVLKAGANINHVNKFGCSALSRAVELSNFEIFDLLLSSDVDLSICGGGAMMNASCYENCILLQKLIELGIDVNYKDLEDGWTALHWACNNSHLEGVELLMNYGADENIQSKDGKTPIELSTNEEVKEFIKNYNSTKFVLK